MYFTREPQIAPEEEIEANRNGSAATATATAEQANEYDPSVLSRVFSGAPGEPPANGATQLLRSAALSSRSNTGVRVIALSRAQQTHGNRFVQRAVAGIQRKTAASQSAQRQSANVSTGESAAGRNVTPSDSPGQPLDQQTREFMEPRFGTDFSDVRVHTDNRATESAEALSSDAYTVGRDIYFASGEYAPTSVEGQHLLAHELTHTIQQADRSSPAPKSSPQDSSVVLPAPDEELEREADQVAGQVVHTKKTSGPPPLPITPRKEPAEKATDGAPGSETPVKTSPIAKESKKRPGAKAAPMRGPAPGEVPGAKSAPSPVVARKGATREASVRPVVALSSTPLPPLPVLDPPVDLIDPTSVAPAFGAPLQMVGYKPEMASAEVDGILAQLQSAAETRKELIRENSGRVKASIAESGATQQMAVSSQIAESLSSVKKRIATARAELSADAGKVKASAAIHTGVGLITLLAKTGAQIKAINDSAQAHKKQASQAVVTEREAVRKFGADESKRGKDAIDKQAQDARTKGNTKASGYPADERGKVQAQAVLKVAADVAEKLAEPGPDLQSSITDGGKELASGVGDVDKEVAKAIDDQTPKMTDEIFRQGMALGPQFETIRGDVSRGVDDFVAETNGKLDEVEESATTELQALEAYINAQIGASVAQVQAMVDSATESEIVAIDVHVTATQQAAKQIRRPHVSGVHAAVEKAKTALDEMVKQFVAGLDELAATAQRSFAEGGDTVVGQIATIAANVRGGLATVRGPARKGLETLGNKAKEGSDKINEEWGKSLVGAQKAVEAKYDEAIAGMVKEIEKELAEGKGKLTSQVNEAITKNREPLDQLDTKMEEAAKEARDKYDAPWYKKVGSWLLHALTSFLKALGILLLVVLAIIVAIVLIIVGIVFDIIALIIIGIIALLAIVIYVLYGIVKGWIDRVLSANTWWQAAWAGIVGILDIVGIPGVIEGLIQHDIVNGRELTVEEAGDRFGSGLLGLLMLILPMKVKGAPAAKGPRIPVEVPIEPRPVPPIEPRPTAPVEPPPSMPKPVEPLPAPKPVEPPPSVPKPPEPLPAPKPVEPPAAPKPREPAPIEPKPAPAEPKPAPPSPEPKPAEPKPAEPKPAEPEPAPERSE